MALRRLDGVGNVSVEFESGEGVVLPAKKRSFDPTRIPQTVRDLGFKPGEIELTVVGSLKKEGDLLLLELPGPLPELVLTGGAQIEALAKKPELLGQRLRLIGRLRQTETPPPGLTVERFERLGAQQGAGSPP